MSKIISCTSFDIYKFNCKYCLESADIQIQNMFCRIRHLLQNNCFNKRISITNTFLNIRRKKYTFSKQSFPNPLFYLLNLISQRCFDKKYTHTQKSLLNNSNLFIKQITFYLFGMNYELHKVNYKFCTGIRKKILNFCGSYFAYAFRSDPYG